jgi:hypothetical protein
VEQSAIVIAMRPSAERSADPAGARRAEERALGCTRGLLRSVVAADVQTGPSG